jgi:hypothetical protein
MKTNVHFLYLTHFFLEREMFRTKVEKMKRHILCTETPPLENCAVCEIMWKNIAEPDRPQMTMGCAHFMLDT